MGNHLCNFREFECLDANTEVEVYDEIENEYKTISLDTMYKQLLRDEIDSKVIISDEKDEFE